MSLTVSSIVQRLVAQSLCRSAGAAAHRWAAPWPALGSHPLGPFSRVTRRVEPDIASRCSGRQDALRGRPRQLSTVWYRARKSGSRRERPRVEERRLCDAALGSPPRVRGRVDLDIPARADRGGGTALGGSSCLPPCALGRTFSEHHECRFRRPLAPSAACCSVPRRSRRGGATRPIAGSGGTRGFLNAVGRVCRPAARAESTSLLRTPNTRVILGASAAGRGWTGSVRR